MVGASAASTRSMPSWVRTSRKRGVSSATLRGPACGTASHAVPVKHGGDAALADAEPDRAFVQAQPLVTIGGDHGRLIDSVPRPRGAIPWADSNFTIVVLDTPNV